MEDASYHHFEDDGAIPNNPTLPVIIYPGAFKENPEDIESVFNQNKWTNSWTNGVFDYHHYHNNTHEVLGVKSGSATLQLGGESGQAFEFTVGDVVILPAGTGHKRLSASEDFQVVGAYPHGAEPEIKTGKLDERPEALEDILDAPLPESDPVFGEDGPVLNNWS
ncbi:cupin domain-containing protein [Planococcus sp. N028]|uniref:Cupin domain-containing protein n=1 Tax=Planococcus shixiaomingii TaxID=3058393 RepID=A0ABT8N1H2_9BACL|nr:cupin domain-containing protein [Planococcus sp. N028]MDN7241549.1 cupin domain-containing protein [Planococcus sp. N028]